MATRNPQIRWGRGMVRGLVDGRLPDYVLRIERQVTGGLTWTDVWANDVTHRAFAWAELPIEQLRRHPEGLIAMAPALVREAYENARDADHEIAAIFRAWLDPQPPEQPMRLRLVS